MELRHLRYAVELGRTMHFTQAAERLGVAQPALSHSIALLERELGITLFVRTSRRVQLTDAGKLFIEHAQNILEQVDALQTGMQEHAQVLRGRVNIGTMVFFFFGETRLARLVAEFAKLHPAIELTIDNNSVQDTLGALRAGTIDVALLNITETAAHRDLNFALIDQDEIAVALPPQHRFATKRRLGFAELADEPFVVYLPGSTMADALTTLAREAGFTPRPAVRSRNIILVRALVAAGAGVSIGPKSYLDSAGPPVVTVPLVPSPTISITMATHERIEANPAARAFVAFVRERFTTVPDD